MKKANNKTWLILTEMCCVLIFMLMIGIIGVDFSVVDIVYAEEADANNLSESELLTQSDDIIGYDNKTIRDYEAIRTTPDISHDTRGRV